MQAALGGRTNMGDTAMITERESNLTYSGESGGLNESMETMKKAWKDASPTPEGRASSEPSDDGSIALLGTSDALASNDFFLI
jgi:hypothetical protein